MPEVRAVLKNGALTFESDNRPENIRLARQLESAVSKSRIGNVVLEQRELLAEKASLLLKQAAVYDDKANDWSLSIEIRDLNARKASIAREEARRIATELGE